MRAEQAYRIAKPVYDAEFARVVRCTISDVEKAIERSVYAGHFARSYTDTALHDSAVMLSTMDHFQTLGYDVIETTTGTLLIRWSNVTATPTLLPSDTLPSAHS